MKLRLLLAAAVVLALVGSAFAGTLSDAKYKLYYHSTSGDIQVRSIDPLPPGSNTSPNNTWRYEYTVLNKSANPLNAFYAFFDSDNVDRARWTSGTAPTNWTITKQGPTAGNFNFKVRYLTTVAGSKIPTNGTLSCTATFTWVGEMVPGPQNYDAVNDGGSEHALTTEDMVVPTRADTWGRIKSLFR
jgi:hypothetical protein